MMTVTASTAVAADGGGGDLRPSLLEVTINGERSLNPVLFLQGPGGTLYASEVAFRAWRIARPSVPPLMFEGEKFYPLNALTSLTVRLSASDQAVSMSAPPSLFQRQVQSVDVPTGGPMSPPSTGAFLTYDIVGEHVGGRSSAAGAFDLSLFTPHGVGETSLVASAGSGPDKVIRLSTNWSIDRPRNATSIRIGDSVSSGGPGAAPVRFGGIQYFRNYAIQPGYITMPLPSGVGSASVPSVVDIYVNNALQSSREVAPGPFELSNIPVQTGGGMVQVVVRDLLGREIVTEQAYYASTQLLRRGLHDFSYEMGFLRRDFGRRSNAYGDFMASTTHRYGVTDRVTVEGHAEASRDIQMGSGSFTWLAFDLGQLEASIGVSRNRRGGTGYRAAAAFERRTRHYAFGFRAEHMSDDYAFLGMPDRFRPPRYTLQAFGDVPIGSFSVGANILHRSLRLEPDETVAAAFARFRLNRHASVQMYARHAVGARRNTTVGATLVMSLGPRRSASAVAEHDRSGFQAATSYQFDPPAGEGGGYRLLGSAGQNESAEAAYVHNFPLATVQAQAGYANGSAGVRLSASGSVGLIGTTPFASRRLGESFAQVRLDGFPGVRVYADNQLVGVTDHKGALIVPGLRAFDRNPIRIEEADLPLDVAIADNELEVRPFARTGTVVRFPVRRERGVLMRIRLEDGRDVPAGATIHLEGVDGSWGVASGGEVYVPDLTGRVSMRAAWSGGTCIFTAVIPDNDDPQPRLDDIVCRTTRYAAN